MHAEVFAAKEHTAIRISLLRDELFLLGSKMGHCFGSGVSKKLANSSHWANCNNWTKTSGYAGGKQEK